MSLDLTSLRSIDRAQSAAGDGAGAGTEPDRTRRSDCTPYTDGPVSLRQVVAGGLLLAITKASLSLLGFARTVRVLRRLVAHSPNDVRPSWDGINARSQAVATAAAFYPGRALCLEQSLALYAWLRWMGIQVDLRLGVQPQRFLAHAWVEHQGQPIREDAEALMRFVPLPGLII